MTVKIFLQSVPTSGFSATGGRAIVSLTLLLLSILLGACAPLSTPSGSGGSWSSTQDAAPRESVDVSTIPDAQPQPVTRTRAGNKSPYTVLGKTYYLLPESRGYQEQGYASWYGTKFHGRHTSNGEIYDIWGMTAAHKTLPIPSYVRVTNIQNGRSVVVRVNDRGPFHSQRIIDLSYAAAIKLGFEKQGVAKVNVVDVTPLSGQPNKTVVSPSSVVIPRNDTLRTPPSKAAAQVAPSSSLSREAVFLQVGAFQQSEPAKNLQAKVQQLLNQPVKVVEGADQWHRVHIGPIADGQLIASIRQRLAEGGIQNAHVIYPK